jgi:4-hydroxybutyrate CoA-transferase
VIALVNPNMPRTHGDSFIHVSDIDIAVESEAPIIELPPPRVGPVEEAIGKHIAGLVDDGSCLQLGIGGIPDAVLLFLHEKSDLGIHTEMFSEGVVDLYEEGVITNARKTLHRDKMVANFLMGTRRLYDFVDDNPAVNMFPVSYVNDPYVIGENDNVVAINSAIQVDLMGQVVADSMGPVQFTGIGGQVDFVRGAARSKGGKSIIALPATARRGEVSRIVARIGDGAAVTTMRADVDYVVTEFGVAELKGKALRERAFALLDIADPRFRDEIVGDLETLKGAAWLRRRQTTSRKA